MRHLPFAVLAFGLAAQPALAQDRPAYMPTRDVSIAYRANSDGTAGVPPGGTELRMSWLAARGLIRVDLPAGQGWMIIDTRSGEPGFLVMEAQRMMMDLPRGQSPVASMTPSATARFTREDTARVANLPCTNWRMEDQGQTSRICLTSDGVMLRAESLTGGAARARLEATAVTFGTQDAARFQRPAGYQTFQMPAGLPGSPGVPGGG
ncbi:MAG: hypothetical protein JWR10_4828, partial [Rubritepida sp.]|nr:hypothetical protein [Rubritepida sp.]